MKRPSAKNRENLRFFLYMTITTSCQQSIYVETAFTEIGTKNRKMSATSCQQGACTSFYGSSLFSV